MVPLPNFPVYHRILEFCHLVGRGFSARPSKKLVHKEFAKDELLYYTPMETFEKKDILKIKCQTQSMPKLSQQSHNFTGMEKS